MSGWGVMTWLAVSAVGPLSFLALVAHRMADCAIGLERLEAEQRKLRQLRREADLEEIVQESIPGHSALTPTADKEGRRNKKVDQPLGKTTI